MLNNRDATMVFVSYCHLVVLVGTGRKGFGVDHPCINIVGNFFVELLIIGRIKVVIHH